MKIVTLVPAYKPAFLEELLISLRQQTRRPDRIVFSDDSPDQAFVRDLNNPVVRAAFPELNIEVVPGPRRGAWANFHQLLEHHVGDADLYHLQLDDDICYPSFYEKHLQAHAAQRADCAISNRWTADEQGQPIGVLDVPQAVATYPQRMMSLGAEVLFPQTVATMRNWLGEASNATFRAATMREVMLEHRIAGISYAGLEDIGSFLAASLKSPIIYINENLGYFRTSPGQHSSQHNGRIFKLGVLCWVPLALAARRLGRVEAGHCAAVIAQVVRIVGTHYTHDAAMTKLADRAAAIGPQPHSAEEEAFVEAWHAYEAG